MTYCVVSFCRLKQIVFAGLLVVVGALLVSGCAVLEVVSTPHLDAYAEIMRSLAGTRMSHEIGGVPFNMRLAPATHLPIFDSTSMLYEVANDFWIAETETTYELWYEVKSWAKGNGYRFSARGLQGSRGNYGFPPPAPELAGHPVTNVRFHDAVIWCNALTEYHNHLHGSDYEPIYRYANGNVIRNIRDASAISAIYRVRDDGIRLDSDGFRLPTIYEWQLAFRYKGDDSSNDAFEAPFRSGYYWSPSNHASGARADTRDVAETTRVAWYEVNSMGGTHPVGLKNPNALELYDMSGNVWEWVETNPFDYIGDLADLLWKDSPTVENEHAMCFMDVRPQQTTTAHLRAAHGGSWKKVWHASPLWGLDGKGNTHFLHDTDDSVGFRFVRGVF